MKTIMITGGCGFIGSHFVKGFLRSHPEWRVINFDKLTYCGNRENTRMLEGDSRYEFVQGDICDVAAVDRVMQKADAVVHFAAETHAADHVRISGIPRVVLIPFFAPVHTSF